MGSSVTLDSAKQMPRPVPKLSLHIRFVFGLFYVGILIVVSYGFYVNFLDTSALVVSTTPPQVSIPWVHQLVNPRLLALFYTPQIQFGLVLIVICGFILGSRGLLKSGREAFAGGQLSSLAVAAAGFASRNWTLIVFGTLLLIFCWLGYKYLHSEENERTTLEILLTLVGVPLASRGLEELLARLNKAKSKTVEGQELVDLMKRIQDFEDRLLAALPNEPKNQKSTSKKKNPPPGGKD